MWIVAMARCWQYDILSLFLSLSSWGSVVVSSDVLHELTWMKFKNRLKMSNQNSQCFPISLWHLQTFDISQSKIYDHSNVRKGSKLKWPLSWCRMWMPNFIFDHSGAIATTLVYIQLLAYFRALFTLIVLNNAAAQKSNWWKRKATNAYTHTHFHSYTRAVCLCIYAFSFNDYKHTQKIL